MEVKGKKITVVGLGVSGKAASLLLKQKGAEVYATDFYNSGELKKIAEELKREDIFIELGGHTQDFIKGSELVVVSPGIPDTSAAIKIADEMSIPVISEIELASWFCKAPIVAVTGTNGKTTTTTLIGLMLKDAGKNTVVCGNIGEAFCSVVSEVTADDIVVAEVSSFQLKRIKNFRAKVAVITNVTQNHLDWHTDFKEYFEAKKNIYKNQKKEDFTILNYDDPNLKVLENDISSQVYFFSRYSHITGAYFDGRHLILDTEKQKFTICSIEDVALKGEHNISNILCSAICAYIFGATKETIKKTLSEFKGLDHRFQDIADINSIRFIDDSKATTVDACRAALSSCRNKVILIAGGRDKNSDFTKIKDLIGEKVKALVLIGEAKAKIKQALDGTAKIYEAVDMDEAVSISWNIAEKDNIVLLSPMCASFDMFRDYKHRGEVFCSIVSKLKTKDYSLNIKTKTLI